MDKNNVIDVFSGNAPLRVQVEADDVMAMLRDNALIIMIALFILMMLSVFAALMLNRALFNK